VRLVEEIIYHRPEALGSREEERIDETTNLTYYPEARTQNLEPVVRRLSDDVGLDGCGRIPARRAGHRIA
jgi:hypothetical protein